jgi:hypothetical protein
MEIPTIIQGGTAQPVIILTTTVNVQNKVYLFQTNRDERIHVYVKRVRKWLEETSLPILLVENTGHTFEELAQEKEIYKNRFEVISYKESELPEAIYLRDDHFKGTSEIFAIQYAYQKSSLLKQPPFDLHTFVIKITGRFYIPDLENYLRKNLTVNTEVLVQNRKERCEMVGCHRDLFYTVFDTQLMDETGNITGNVEDVYKYRCSIYKNVLHCPQFYIEPTQRGGINEVFYNI